MKAKTTLEFIADLKQKTGLDSDYAIAKLLGITKNALSLYRNGKSYFGEDVAMKVAEILELEDGYVLACIAAERTKNERAKRAWQHLGGFAAALAVLAVLPFVPGIGADNLSGAALLGFTTTEAGTLYIM